MKSAWTKYASAALAGCLLTLAQPLPWEVNFGFLAWVALVPLVIPLRGASQGRRFAIGAIAGGIHYLTSLYWLMGTLNTYGNLNLPGSIFTALLLMALQAAYFILVAVILGKLSDHAPRLPLAASLPLLWVTMEFLRATFPFGGFPWALLGYSQGEYTHLAQAADIGGVYLVSFAVALVNGAISDLVEKLGAKTDPLPWRSVAAAMILIAAMFAYGTWRVSEVKSRMQKSDPVKVAVLQGDIRQDMKWDSDTAGFIINRYMELHNKAVREGARLIVWPEAALPFALERHMEGLRLTARLRDMGVYSLVGSVDFHYENRRRKFTNSAYLIGPDGIEGKYSKIHLVPFGEYIPFVKYLGFVDKIVKGAAGNFSAGEEIEVFKVPQGEFGVIICYEAIYGNLTRKFSKNGAGLLVNITNDAWFGDTSAPRQHLAMAAFRCIENHVWMARAANTGISAFIDPLGRVKERTKLFTPALPVMNVSFMPGVTPYAAVGDLFLYAVVVICIAVCTWVFLKSKKGKMANETGN